MNALQIDIFGLSIMNNSFVHFFIAGALLGLFVWATFFTKGEEQAKAVKMMKICFIFVLLSGCMIWTIVDFSIPLLIKSVGGIALFWFLLQIVKEPTSKLFWGLSVVTATVGLSLAFTMI